MSSQFLLNTLVYGDEQGWGDWLMGHYRQHLVYNTFLATQPVPIIIDIFPIMLMEGGETGLKFWLDAHNNWHEQVRPFANVTGIDLSEVNFKNPDEWYQWIDTHNQEHSDIDTAFRIA